MVTRQQVSAGGVVYRRSSDGNYDVVLVSTKGGTRWGLPKGTVAPSEDHAATARREVREETGLEAEILEPLAPIEYWYWGHEDGERMRFHKKVYFFLMLCRSGDTAGHDWEVDEARWFRIEEAAAKASFPTERKAIEEARQRLAGDAGRPPQFVSE